MADLEIVPVTVQAGSTVSLPAPIGVKTPVAVSLPASYAGGALKFNVSPDGGATWQPLFDSTNTEVAISAPGAGTFIALNPVTFAGVNELQIVVATAPSANMVIGLAVRTAAF